MSYLVFIRIKVGNAGKISNFFYLFLYVFVK
jgi:hypothetical protein